MPCVSICSGPMRIHELKRRLQAAGAGPLHERRILRMWSHALPRDSGRRLPHTFFPLALLAALPAIEAELAGLARVAAAHPGGDGSERLLVALADGQTVESVLLPRGGLCVSSQVGCAVGCQFCMTGARRLAAPGRQRRDRGAGRARTPSPQGDQGGLHGHGRTGAQPGQRDGGDRAARHHGRHRAQEPGVLYRGRPTCLPSGCTRPA